VWKALEDFSNSRGPLYPDGLYNLLMKE